jgi:hypothetical protein
MSFEFSGKTEQKITLAKLKRGEQPDPSFQSGIYLLRNNKLICLNKL